MLDHRLEKVIGRMRAVKLTSHEKTDILGQVFSIVEKMDMVADQSLKHAVQAHTPRAVPSPWMSYLKKNTFVPAIAVAVLFLSTGGVSLAAESALPGDLLYPLKINVNEGVLGLLAIGPEAKARFALITSQNRLEEAATLSAQGKLNDRTKGILQQEFTDQAAQVGNQVASLVSTNDIDTAQDLALNFESSLKAQEIILQTLSNKDSLSPDAYHINAFLGTLNAVLATTTITRSGLQNEQVVKDVNNRMKIEGELDQTKIKLQETVNLESSVDSVTPLDSNIKAMVNQNISDARSAIAKSEAYLAGSSSMEAIIVMQQADRAITDAESAIVADCNAAPVVQQAITSTSTGASSISVPNAVSTSTASTTPDVSSSTTPPAIGTGASTATTSSAV